MIIRQMTREQFAVAYEFLQNGMTQESVASMFEIRVKRLHYIIVYAEIHGFEAFA